MNVVLRMNISEMPTACGPCELSCTAFCKEWTKVDRKEIGRTKSPNCPIIAILPEGHGDLIDRDIMVDEWVDEKIGNPHADYEADDVIYDLKKRTVIVPKDKAHEP